MTVERQSPAPRKMAVVTTRGSPGGCVAVTGATAIPRAALVVVQIRTTDGRALLTLSR